MDARNLQKAPIIIKDDFSIVRPERIPLSAKSFQEEWLQQLLEQSPQLLSVSEIDSIFAPLVCIGREVPTAAGYIDNLYISPSGYLTIVETKLWRNPEARREVVGQILDYAKDLCHWSYQDLDQWVKTYFSQKHIASANLFQHMVSLDLLTDQDEARFIDATEKNMQNARFLLMIVGDGIREGVIQMTDFLNETPNLQYTLALLEIEVYQVHPNERIIVPNLLMRTVNIERGIIRIEGLSASQAQIEFTSSTAQENVSDKSNKGIRTTNPLLSIEDYLQQLSQVNPDLDIDSVRALLDDLDDLGFILQFVKHCTVKYRFPGSNKTCTMLYLTTDAQFFHQVDTLGTQLSRMNFSSEIANQYWDEMFDLLNNQSQEIYQSRGISNYFASGSISNLIDHKEKFLTILEKFMRSFA